jgi:hypothetical protein
MRRIIFGSIVFLVGYFSSHAQDMCHTEGSDPDLLQQIPQNHVQTPSNNYVVRIFIHVMRRDDGSGGQDATSVETAKQILVNMFEPLGICVSLLGSDEIWSTNYYDYWAIGDFTKDGDGDGKMDNFHPNSHTDAVDIYLFGEDSGLQGGKAAKIPSTSLVLGGNMFSTNLIASPIIAHELGHCLGLYHTNHGFEECGEDAGGCPKLVNLSNWATCGDFVSDTQQDPSYGQTTLACNWTGGTCPYVSNQDANGAFYIPDMHNIMVKYMAPYCYWYFTTGQGDRIRYIIANSTLLQASIVPNYLTINSLTIGSGETKLYHVLNEITLQFDVSVNSGGTLVARAGEQISLYYDFTANYSSDFHAYIDNDCSTIDADNSARKRLTTNNPESTNTFNSHGLTVAVYPNPASKKIIVSAKTKQSRINFKLLTISGTLIREANYFTSKGISQSEQDISILPVGIYVVRVFDGKETVANKIVKVN